MNYLTGNRKKEKAAAAAPAAPAGEELGPDMASNLEDYSNATFTAPVNPTLYNPYNLTGGIDPNNIPNLKLGQAEFLFPDAAVKKRSFGERLCYGTGLSVLAGNAIGGTWGLYEGLRHPEGTTMRRRINAVLNGCSKRGPFVGNSFGVIALMYNGINGGVVELRDGHDDMYNQVASAVTTGVLFKSTAGLRRMALAGGVGGGLAVAMLMAEQMFFGESSSSSSSGQYL